MQSYTVQDQTKKQSDFCLLFEAACRVRTVPPFFMLGSSPFQLHVTSQRLEDMVKYLT